MAESATTPPAAVPAELLERELEIEALEAALAAVVALRIHFYNLGGQNHGDSRARGGRAQGS